MSGTSVKPPHGGPDIVPATDQIETQGTFTATAAQATALDRVDVSDIYDPYLYSVNDPVQEDNSGIRFVGGRGINVFSTDQSAMSIEANAPEIEFLDGLTTQNPGDIGSVDNLLVTYPNNTDLGGTPLTSTLAIPVIDDVVYNTDAAPNVLNLRRNGGDPDLTVTFGEAASRAVADEVRQDTDGESVASVAAVRGEATAIRNQLEDQLQNQKLEDHHGVQPVFTQGGSTPIPQAQRNVLSDAAHIPFRTDTRSGILDTTFSTLYYDPLGALVIIIQGAADATTWVDTINHIDNGVVTWRGDVAGFVDGETQEQLLS